MIVTAIVLALIVGIIEIVLRRGGGSGIPYPLNWIIYIGLIALLAWGIVTLIFPGFPWVGRY